MAIKWERLQISRKHPTGDAADCHIQAINDGKIRGQLRFSLSEIGDENLQKLEKILEVIVEKCVAKNPQLQEDGE